MKTIKLIILTAVLTTVISCSGDRDENVVEPAKTSNQKIKLNNSDLQKEDFSTASAIQDTIRPVENAAQGEDPITPPNGETIDPTKPDKPW